MICEARFLNIISLSILQDETAFTDDFSNKEKEIIISLSLIFPFDTIPAVEVPIIAIFGKPSLSSIRTVSMYSMEQFE